VIGRSARERAQWRAVLSSRGRKAANEGLEGKWQRIFRPWEADPLLGFTREEEDLVQVPVARRKLASV